MSFHAYAIEIIVEKMIIKDVIVQVECRFHRVYKEELQTVLMNMERIGQD